jgi:hypothetical protein
MQMACFDISEFKIGSCWEITFSKYNYGQNGYVQNGLLLDVGMRSLSFAVIDPKSGNLTKITITADAVSNGIVKLVQLVNPGEKEKKTKKKEDKIGWDDMLDAMVTGKLQSDADKANNSDGFDIINDIKTFAYQDPSNDQYKGW